MWCAVFARYAAFRLIAAVFFGLIYIEKPAGGM
jgi:hypothetical protein